MFEKLAKLLHVLLPVPCVLACDPATAQVDAAQYLRVPLHPYAINVLEMIIPCLRIGKFYPLAPAAFLALSFAWGTPSAQPEP